MFVCIRSSFHSVHFGQLLRCAHKRIVNITKVYIERNNNKQVELILFRKNIATLLMLETLKWEYTFATDVSGHDHFGTYSIRYIVTSGQARFGTAQLHYFKLLCTGSSHGKSVQAPIQL